MKTNNEFSLKKFMSWGASLTELGEHAFLDLWVVNSSPSCE